MSTEEEPRIRELFHQMREEDEVDLPSFSETLDARRRNGGRAGFWSFRLKLALTVVVLVAFVTPVLVYLQQGGSDPREQLAAELLEWESPTDFLLTFSEDTLWTTLPTVDADLPAWVEEEYEE